MHLKFVDGSEDEIEGMLVPYGGIFNGRDVTGEYFSAKTNLCLNWYEGDRPLLFHHGLDESVEAEPVGRIKSIEVTDKGAWMRGWLDKRSEYYDAVKEMITEKALELSSGAMGHLVRKAKSGEILRWPLVEGSLTPTPACPGLATVDFATAKSHFKSAGIEVDFEHLKASLDAEDAPAEGSDPAPTTDPEPAETKSVEGSYEDLIEDLCDALNPMTPFGSYTYSWIVATFPDHVIVGRCEEDDDTTYWRVEYTLDDAGEPVLGSAEQVEQTYVPTKAFAFEGPLTLDAQALARHAGALVRRTEGTHERRVKEGRVLSAGNRQRLTEAADTLEQTAASLRSLIATSEQTGQDQAKAVALSSPDALRREVELLMLFEQTV